jgi:hypothetical protein
MWLKQCHKPSMTGNGFYIPPINMVMAGGKHGIVLTTLKQNRSHTVIMSSKRTIQSLAWFE